MKALTSLKDEQDFKVSRITYQIEKCEMKIYSLIYFDVLHFRKVILEAGEMAQLVKCLLYDHQDFSWTFSTYMRQTNQIKELSMLGTLTQH